MTILSQNFEESGVCLSRLLQIDPDNKAGKAELVKLKKAKKEYQMRSKEISQNIANKLFHSNKEKDSVPKVTAKPRDPATLDDTPISTSVISLPVLISSFSSLGFI